jgi:hypothetical protein
MIFSTNYFGELPYFQALAKQDEIIIDVNEFYKKQTWRNRTQILGSNGLMYLSVPVLRPNGSKSTVKEIEIGTETPWRKDHWKAIESSYKHAPFFFYYGPLIKDMIYRKEKYLIDFNQHILENVLNWLDLNISVTRSEEYIAPESQSDYRVALDKKKFEQEQRKYIQVFSDKMPFYPNISILDLLMNEGPLARTFVFDKERNLFTGK